jgi:hypothetical protein
MQPGSDGGKELGEFQEHKKKFVSTWKTIPNMKPGVGGSMTKLRLYQIHSLFQIGSRTFESAWKTPPGRYLALACLTFGAIYNFRIAQAEKAKNLVLVKKHQDELKAMEVKMQNELASLKSDHATLKKNFEDSQKSWLGEWIPWFKKR